VLQSPVPDVFGYGFADDRRERAVEIIRGYVKHLRMPLNVISSARWLSMYFIARATLSKLLIRISLSAGIPLFACILAKKTWYCLAALAQF